MSRSRKSIHPEARQAVADAMRQTTGSFAPDQIGEAPTGPGVYIMFDSKGRVIYVGKAQNLRARLRQYFMESGGDSRATVPFIRKALHHVETILTSNEKEAFLLENTLIKRHRPRYNVRLRDDKTYVSVQIDLSDEWPRPVVTRIRKPDRTLSFGPYVSARAIRQTLRFLQKVFPLRACSDKVFRNRTRPCMLYQIGLCSGACAGLVSREVYDQNLRGTIAFLRGHTGEVVDLLRRRMQEFSDRMEYEKARAVRDQLAMLEESMERQRVASHSRESLDAIGYAEERGQAALVALFFRNGHLVESGRWVMAVHGEPPEKTLSNFLGQYYREGSFIPPELLLPFAPLDGDLIAEWLGDLRDGRVCISVPQRGKKLELTRMACQNAREILQRKISGQGEIEDVLADLAKRLHLSDPPRSIECYDIATLQGSQSAGSRVVFVDGEPCKTLYRLYAIRTIEGQDDFGMMREVLTRRFRAAGQRKGEDLPDLMVVDGGKGQLGVAREVLEELGIDTVALAALVKSHLRSDPNGEKTRTPEHLFLPGRKNPVIFPPHAPSFYLLQRLRDEAHRFVNAYHAKRRGKTNLRSGLLEIEGVGEKRARSLLRHFGSLSRIREASLEALARAPGMTRPISERVYRHFHPDEA